MSNISGSHINWEVVSLGGSLIFPDSGLDSQFVDKFVELVSSATEEGRRFIIVAGGGSISREYQRAIEKIARVNQADVDRIGISALRTNAHFLRLAFEGEAYPETIDESTNIDQEVASYPIVVGGAKEPGKSTDFNAVCLAEKVNAERVINLSNVDHVYDGDPNKNSDARPLDEISWEDYRDIIPRDFTPGLSTPFDPVAAKKAEALGLDVVIMNGDTTNLASYLEGNDFDGTIIHS